MVVDDIDHTTRGQQTRRADGALSMVAPMVMVSQDVATTSPAARCNSQPHNASASTVKVCRPVPTIVAWSMW
jgi:hypothetical protein